ALRRRGRRVVSQLRGCLDALPSFLHFVHRLPRAALDGLDDGADLLRRSARALGELADLVGHDRESETVLARLRGDDRGVQGEEVGAVGDLFDDVEDLADLPDAALQLLERSGGGCWCGPR